MPWMIDSSCSCSAAKSSGTLTSPEPIPAFAYSSANSRIDCKVCIAPSIQAITESLDGGFLGSSRSEKATMSKPNSQAICLIYWDSARSAFRTVEVSRKRRCAQGTRRIFPLPHRSADLVLLCLHQLQYKGSRLRRPLVCRSTSKRYSMLVGYSGPKDRRQIPHSH